MYDLLEDVRVLDVSLLAPSMLGMRLAEFGADVIKIEQPPYGDRYRTLMAPFRGVEGAPGILHMFANRGKRSLALDLKKPAGRDIFLELAAQSDVVIVGLRSQAMDTWGLDYEAIAAANPRIVYCLLSGLGSWGPYKNLGTHGAYFDGYAGLSAVAFREEDGLPYIGESHSIGTIAAPLYAATGILAALHKATKTGKGSRIEIAQTDVAVLFQTNNATVLLAGEGKLAANPRGTRDAVRYQNYETKDGRYLMFFPMEEKFWERFCTITERPDLLNDGEGCQGNAMNTAYGNEALRAELVAIFKTRTQAEWTEFFLANDIPGGPVHDLAGALQDPHFLARDNIVEQEYPDVGLVKMLGSPVKVDGQHFDIRAAPRVGEHSDEILREVLNYDAARIRTLRDNAVVG